MESEGVPHKMRVVLMFRITFWLLMSSFKRILFPLNGNVSALDYAVDLAKQSDAMLYLLHTYRLVDIKQRHKEGGSIIRNIDDELEQNFRDKYESRLVDSKIQYEFMLEIGFLMDRIISNIKEKEIDILLLDKLKVDGDEAMIERFNDIKVPVMLIPDPNLDSLS